MRLPCRVTEMSPSSYCYRPRDNDLIAVAWQWLGIAISMAGVGQATENAYAERVIRIIKEEEEHLPDYESFEDAAHRICHFVTDVYQTKRMHSA
jgi:transposase InsO family protein